MSSMTVYAKCALCHQFETVYEWGTEYLCRVCVDKTAAAMGEEQARRVEPQDCAMCGGYDLRCPRCKGGRE